MTNRAECNKKFTGDMKESEKRKWPKPPLRLTVWVFCLLFLIAEGAIIRHVVNLDILDARLAYSPAQALAMFETLDASSMSTYRTFNKVDFALILLYSALLVTWFRLLDPDVEAKLRGWPWLGLLPGLFDLVETTGIALLLHSEQPGQSPGLWMAVAGTPLKWFWVAFALSLLLFAELTTRIAPPASPGAALVRSLHWTQGRSFGRE